MSCRGRLSTGRSVGGRAMLEESILRRLTTPRGTLYGGAEESTYGLDLSAYVGAVGDTVAAVALPSVVESELLKDERIASVVASVVTSVLTGGLRTFRVRVDVTPIAETETFSMVLAVSLLTVEILGGMPS